MHDIPLIDLAGPRQGGEGEVARQIDRACTDVGFFTVHGHGIDRSVIADAYAALEQFFALPLGEKVRCRFEAGITRGPDDYTPYGYSALLEENALAYMGRHGLPSDYVEKFSVGRLILDDGEPLPFVEGESGRDLRQALKRYYVACEALAARIGEMFARAIGLPRDYFTSRIDKAEDSMRAHYYPARSREFANDQGMGEHTDGTLLTLLTQTGPGIEVRLSDGRWVRPQVGDLGHFIVNVGDLMAHWTKGRYRSTAHRVVLSEQDRYSIVFFKLTNDDEMVQLGNRQMDALFGRDGADEPRPATDREPGISTSPNRGAGE